ncbi:MAG: hypothetical protein RIF33_06450 [Cyclobacteriaceae bacterium]
MNARELQQYAMQRQVKKYLNAHTDKWSAIPAAYRSALRWPTRPPAS